MSELVRVTPTRQSAITALLRPKTAKKSEPLTEKGAHWLQILLDETAEGAQVLWAEPRDYFRMSSVGGTPCVRALVLEALGHRVPFPAQKLRIFATGKAIERGIVATLCKRGVLLGTNKVVNVADPPLRGHYDVLMTRPSDGATVLVEIKSINEDWLTRLPPVSDDPLVNVDELMRVFPRYVIQWQMYAWALGLREGCLLFEGKDRQRDRIYDLVLDHGIVSEIEGRCAVAWPYLKDRMVPPVPDDRKPSSKDDVVCVKCDHAYLCRRLKSWGASYEEARREDAKVRG